MTSIRVDPPTLVDSLNSAGLSGAPNRSQNSRGQIITVTVPGHLLQPEASGLNWKKALTGAGYDMLYFGATGAYGPYNFFGPLPNLNTNNAMLQSISIRTYMKNATGASNFITGTFFEVSNSGVVTGVSASVTTTTTGFNTDTTDVTGITLNTANNFYILRATMQQGSTSNPGDLGLLWIKLVYGIPALFTANQ